MKNVTAIKSKVINESPKTPGGISKSLLTPCRRVGLSRNWKKSCLSPFISPLSSSSTNNVDKNENRKETRKRKERTNAEEPEDESPRTPVSEDGTLDIDVDDINTTPPVSKSDNLNNTPCRNVVIPRKKKSKTLLSAINNSKENFRDSKEKSIVKDDIKLTDNNSQKNRTSEVIVDVDSVTVKCTAGESNLCNNPDEICQSALKSPRETKIDGNCNSNAQEVEIIEHPTSELVNESKSDYTNRTDKQKSPNELTKECIVVIQRRLLKTKKKDKEASKINKSIEENKTESTKPKSQELLDSDSEDVPLNKLNKSQNEQKNERRFLDNGMNFKETSNRTKVAKLDPKNTNGSKDSVKEKSNNNNKSINISKTKIQKEMLSQEFEDDEDFDFNPKRTIVIRKSYDKVTKPLKAKSTGSITDKDINDLRARLEVKKKLLLAKAMTDDTEELRALIKKWQKGCQDALMELMDLMKIKCSDKQNMSYSEILQMLKIPSSLVGYDSENECFNTPDDTSIILSNLNDL